MVPNPRKLSCALASLALLVACGVDGESPRPARFSALQLDAIDAALERLGAGRWVSWTMELAGDALELRVELAEATQEARACTQIETALRGVASAPVVWHAELVRGGAVVGRCEEAGRRTRV